MGASPHPPPQASAPSKTKSMVGGDKMDKTKSVELEKWKGRYFAGGLMVMLKLEGSRRSLKETQ